MDAVKIFIDQTVGFQMSYKFSALVGAITLVAGHKKAHKCVACFMACTEPLQAARTALKSQNTSIRVESRVYMLVSLNS